VLRVTERAVREALSGEIEHFTGVSIRTRSPPRPSCDWTPRLRAGGVGASVLVRLVELGLVPLEVAS